MGYKGAGGKRLLRPMGNDQIAWKETMVAALNEIGVSVGEEFLIVHPERWPGNRPEGTRPVKVERDEFRDEFKMGSGADG